MAKKVTGYIKLQIPAGKATPAPPVGPALGQHGVNIVEFTKQFNAKTADMGDSVNNAVHHRLYLEPIQVSAEPHQDRQSAERAGGCKVQSTLKFERPHAADSRE